MKISLIGQGRTASCCYLLTSGEAAAIVDPSLPLEQMLAALQGCTLTHIFITHRHYDHIGGLAALVEATGATTYAHEADAAAICDNSFQGNASSCREVGLEPHMRYENLKPIDVQLHHGQQLDFGGTQLTVLSTPGHTAGSLCLYSPADALLVSGDTLFGNGHFGRTDLPSASMADMVKSLHNLSALPPETKVYPGHGQPTTIARELKLNPYLR